MARTAKSPDDYVPFRVAEQSYKRDPRPEFAYLAHAAGRAIADVMLEEALLDPRGRPLKTVPMDLVSRHAPTAPRAFTVHGLTLRHPESARPHATYWGLPLPEFEHAHLVEPEDLAVSCVEALRRTFTGSPLWAPKTHMFHSATPNIPYNQLAMQIAEEGAVQPEEPLTTDVFSEYAAHVGGRALVLASGSPDTGGVQMFTHDYTFVPKAQALAFHEETPPR